MNKTYTLQHQVGAAQCVIHVANRGTRTSSVPPRLLDPLESRNLWNHSPSGFEFGYGGSGPAQLALGILLDHCRTHKLPDLVALEHHQAFKWEFIARAHDGTVITTEQIEKFLALRAYLASLLMRGNFTAEQIEKLLSNFTAEQLMEFLP